MSGAVLDVHVLQRVAELRRHRRYVMRLPVEYRMRSEDYVRRSGFGETRNISSGGVLFDADGSLPTGSQIELLISWPVLLDDTCPLRLAICGSIIRAEGRRIAVALQTYGFRTTAVRLAKRPPASLAAACGVNVAP